MNELAPATSLFVGAVNISRLRLGVIKEAHHVLQLGRCGSLQVVFGADGRWFESHFSRHAGTLGKSFTSSCLYDVMWRPAWLPCG